MNVAPRPRKPKPKILIDRAQCGVIAEHIAKLGVPKDEEDPMALSFPSLVAENAWWAVVAICHQTTPVQGAAFRGYVGGTLRKGWDYLLQKSIVEANRDPKLFTRAWLEQVSGEDLIGLYHDDTEGDTLNNPRSRAELLRELGAFLARNNWESIRECYVASEGYIIRKGGGGLAERMQTVRAYADPVEKKFFYFLALMQNQGFWKYRDPKHLSSPVNYHEQRGHFRLGSVRITDPELEAKVRARVNITPEEDIEIRFAVRRAIEYIARLLGITPAMAHYFFWNYFRNCCAREAVHCGGCGDACKLPERYRMGQHSCVLAPACKSRGMPVGEMLIEPRLDDTIWQ